MLPIYIASEKKRTYFNVADGSFAQGTDMDVTVDLLRSHYYAQVGHHLYARYTNSPTSIIQYDLQDNSYVASFASFPPPLRTEVSRGSCMDVLGDTGIIFVIGGADSFSSDPTYFDIFHILDTSTIQWTIGPAMTTTRGYHACAICQGHIWAIGGIVARAIGLASFEKIGISSSSGAKPMDLAFDGNWTLSNTELPHDRRFARAHVHGNDILLIGGYSLDRYVRTVHIINAITEDVSDGPSLLDALSSPATIIVDERLFVFAGWDGRQALDSWQYLDLLSLLLSCSTQDKYRNDFVPSA